MSRIVYKLNGYNLNTLGIIVKSADGLLDMPDLKKRKECDWADMHGKIIDTARPYFDTRKITLDCAWPIAANGSYNIQTAEQKIREDLLALGALVRLEVEFDSSILAKPLIFNVIQDKGITFGRKYSGSDVLLTFKIQLIEPQPCKMVLESKYSRNNNTRTTTSVAITSTAMFDVDWGDGTTTFDVKTSEAVTHTYSGQGTYYVIISGDVAAITSLTKSSDLDTLWTLK